MTGTATFLLILVAVVALGLAALLAAGEAALVRATRSGLQDAMSDAEDAGPAGVARRARVRRAQSLTEDPATTSRAVGVTRVVLEVLAIACLVLVIDALVARWLVLVVAVAVSAGVAVLLSRVSPRTVGLRNPVPVLVALAGVLDVVARATRWAIPVQEDDLPSAERTDREAREVADRVSDLEDIEEQERELIRSVIELGQTLTREIMVPRTDMVTTRATTPLRSTVNLFERSGFSRIPVTGVDTDDLVGVAFFKDVVRAARRDGRDARVDDVPVGDVAREAMFVPESKPVDELLREMQAASSHIALVVDEYGGVAGLVTIEDALEELVGELTDEHDRSGPEVEEVGDGVYRVPARYPISELGELFDRHIDHDDVDSAGGLLAKALGKVPLLGAAADTDGLHLEAERVEGRRKQVATLLVHRLPDAYEDERNGERPGDRSGAEADPAREQQPARSTEDR
ncbi:membrane protein [Paraoerskovia sediminicola]|uniref:Membrane protein n=1 Tax=Paraoerskovia sediminicola TaxID=1138587 RepID=A0ABN6XE56_9CELL|nr:hemolysin family protein [Paraoerskovia sediminicola]BDZ43213.1 membrane protein [Paraoerskovia sediminicola]